MDYEVLHYVISIGELGKAAIYYSYEIVSLPVLVPLGGHGSFFFSLFRPHGEILASHGAHTVYVLYRYIDAPNAALHDGGGVSRFLQAN